VLSRADADISLTPNADGESGFGDLAADCMRKRSTAPFAVLPLVGTFATFGTVLKAGDITWATIDALATDGRIVETTLTGQQIIDLLNAQFGQFQNRFLAISGFTYVWGGTPGSVIDIFDAQGAKLSRTQSYAIALPYFWRNTSLNLLKPMPANLTLGPVLADAFATCLKAMPTVTAPVDGRVKRSP